MILYLKAFDVLTADVDDEIRLGIEMERRFEMRHRFHDAEIRFHRGFDEIVAVPRHRARANIDAVFGKSIDLFELFHHDIERLPVIGLIMGIQNPIILRNEDHLRGSRAAVYSEVSVAAIGVNVRKRQVAALMARNKRVVFPPTFKERLSRHDVVAVSAVLDFPDDLGHGCLVRVFRVQRGA